MKVPVHIINGIKDGPTKEYYDEYHRLNQALDELALKGASYLKERGYQAHAQTTDVIVTTKDNRTKLPHKTIATRAGIGWIGKSNLLITKEYGSAIRLTSILTDAKLAYAKPIDEGMCGSCKSCQNACFAQAIKGPQWDVSLDRDDMFDMPFCEKKGEELTMNNFGISYAICGKCIEVCPYTKIYLKKLGEYTT